MKVSALVAVLSNFEDAVVAAAGVETRSGFKEFRGLFLNYENKNIAPFVDTLITLRDARGRKANSRPIALLRESLTKLETCLRSADAKKAADDVAKLAALLEDCGQVSVDAFVKEAHMWLAEASRPADYVSLLKRTAENNAQFDQTIERLRSDTKVKAPEMRDIARQFLGYELTQKKISKKDVLEKIIAKQRIEARQDARGSVLDRLKAW